MRCKLSFITDKEKMRDFFRLSKRDFLNSYSCLSAQEYNATFIDVYKRILKINTHKHVESTARDIMFTKDNIKIYDEAFIDVDIDNKGRLMYDTEIITALLDCSFDVEKNFNIKLNDDEYFGLYINYNPISETFKMFFSIRNRVNGDSTYTLYNPTKGEKELVISMLFDNIKQYHKKTPMEFYKDYIAFGI